MIKSQKFDPSKTKGQKFGIWEAKLILDEVRSANILDFYVYSI